MNLNSFFQDWLGIETDSETLPDYYTLFGLPPMEENAERIRTAIASRFESFLQLDFGAHRAEYVEILQILTEARLTLTNLVLKRQYDERFRLMNRTWKKYERPTLRVRMQQFASISAAMVLGLFVVYLMANSVERNPDGSIRYQVETLDAPIAMFTTIPDCVKSRVPRPTSIHAKKRIGAPGVSAPESEVPDSLDVADSVESADVPETLAADVPESVAAVEPEVVPESVAEAAETSADSRQSEAPQESVSIRSGSSRVGPLYRGQQAVAQAPSNEEAGASADVEIETESNTDVSTGDVDSALAGKLPLPDLKEVARKREESLGKLLPELTTPDLFDEAIAQLLAEGEKPEGTSATRYTYFLLALDLSVQKLKVSETYEILKTIANRFELPDNQLRYETTAQLYARLASEWKALESADVLETFLGEMQEDMNSLLTEGRYEDAKDVAKQAIDLLTRTGIQNAELLAQIQKTQAHAEQMIKWKSVAEDCQKKLEKNPNNPTANYYYALWLCQKSMRWTDEAIPYFARCGNPEIIAVAQLEQSMREQGTVKDSRNIFILAEKWWELTEASEVTTEKFYFRQHARALDDLVDKAQLGDDEQLRISERMEGRKN